ncbi:hypothetical protein ULMA_25330 [Patiriisocius marinus]|uniref:Uncharacterized protein n=1 Tax=Patiriisocius marinus TaxID=1397112 RepID=A0A5J4IRC4_9FLAO|nr:hypothetical protein ULMA_25330 [Patiriisocius marinus]
MAPYSPILFGVANDTASEAKLSFAARLNEMLLKLEIKDFHFKISNNQFANTSITKSAIK